MQSVAQVSQNQTTASSTQKRYRTQLIASINFQLKALQEGVAQVALLPALASAIPDATLLVPVAPDLVQEPAVPHALVPVPAPVTIPVPGLALAPVLAPVAQAVPEDARAPVAQAVLEDARALVVQTVPLRVLLAAPAVVPVDALAVVVVAMDHVEVAALENVSRLVCLGVEEIPVRAIVHLSALIAVHSGKKVVYQNE